MSNALSMLRRFIAPFFCAICLFVVGGFVHAAIPASVQYYFNWDGVPTGHASSKPGACGNMAPYLRAKYNEPAAYGEWSEQWGGCVLYRSPGDNFGLVSLGTTPASCPPNSSFMNGASTCTCTSPYLESGGQCVLPSCPNGSTYDPAQSRCVPFKCPAGEVLQNQNCVKAVDTPGDCSILAGQDAGMWDVAQKTGSLGNKKICDSVSFAGKKCMVKGESDFCGEMQGTYYCSFRGSYSGGNCTPDNSASPDADETVDKDKAAEGNNEKGTVGKCPGTVNGVTVHVECSSKNSSETKVTPGDKPGDGVSVKEDIVCTGQMCTKDVYTVTTVNGSSSGTHTTSSGTKDQICAGSKQAACTGVSGAGGDGEDGSSFGGSCKSGFTCDGDAATCAIAKATNESKCRLFDLTDGTDSAMLTFGQTLASGGLGDIKDPKKTEGGMITIAMQKLEAVVNPYGETCPANIPLNIAGHQVVLPMADYCNILRNLGNVLWASTIFVSTVFVLKGNG